MKGLATRVFGPFNVFRFTSKKERASSCLRGTAPFRCRNQETKDLLSAFNSLEKPTQRRVL